MTRARLYVYAGARSPEALCLTIIRGASPIDLSTVSAASIAITGRDTPWTCAIVSQSASEMQISHIFQAGDCDTIGEILVARARLTIAGGVHRTEPFEIQVLE